MIKIIKNRKLIIFYSKDVKQQKINQIILTNYYQQDFKEKKLMKRLGFLIKIDSV